MSETNGIAGSKSLSGLKVLIIGAGFGGLASAIELQVRGATVKVLELSPDMRKQGDVIMMGPNATMIMKKWGQCLPELLKGAAQPRHMVIANKEGKGVEVVFDARVTDVTETEESATVTTADGQTYTGDVVIAADGVHSKARAVVVGVKDRPKKSGFAVYRSWFDFAALRQNPKTKFLADSEEALFQMWIDQDKHAIITTNPNLQKATCFVTHKDTADIKEDWNLPGDPADMLAMVEGWDPLLTEVIKQVPRDCLIDYKLLWRDPVRKWVSDHGRVALVGDAAHPHLSTSGTGGAQAIEDAATIAALLEKLGKGKAALALRAYEKLRYERTSLTQRMGFETRHVWHQTDWEAVSKNPEVLKFPQPAWLNGIDAGDYATRRCEEVVAHLEGGAPFASTNIPDGFVHEDWTIEEMLAHEGKKGDFYKTR
ncbi:hypothetical protein EDD36DRAFT_449989 [Exophiala viscosa]|uniref:FAD-binding domain-containing protein n=1 Tax=Exophiala viscosa TaxID=2486360 RepID=A0AAN6IK90_9EURO|nr:hypothetical protein EDD36DRAFT_449989 [Exophiala viscosa]